MKVEQSLTPGRWLNGDLPANTRVGMNSVISCDYAFKRFRSRRSLALIIGAHCTMDGVHFALGEDGQVEIGDYCYFTNAVLRYARTVRWERWRKRPAS